MEITDRDDLGFDLHAPQVDGAGREYWSYALVTEVQEGDIVLHWWKRAGQEPAIVGWSTAVGAVEESPIIWNAHGTAGRARGTTTKPQAGWRMPLENFTEPDRAVTLGDLRAIEDALRAEREALEADVPGPLYFPFSFSEKRELRTAQGYLVKVPVSVIRAIPGLAGVLAPSTASRSRRRSTKTAPNDHNDDPLLRKRIEEHAVEITVRHLESLGYSCENVGATKPYDLVARLPEEGTELHVEVKGSSGDRLTVGLTDGEVKHAETFEETLLSVVDGIEWRRTAGEIKTSGGRLRLWWQWVPDQDALVPTAYRYLLPPNAVSPTPSP